LREVINDDEYLNGQFIKTVASRGGEIISVRGLSSAASAGSAACDHMHDWWFGNKLTGYVSMGVILEEETYGVKGGICYSMPCNIVDGKYQIVEGLEINEFSKEKIAKSEQELLGEKAVW